MEISLCLPCHRAQGGRLSVECIEHGVDRQVRTSNEEADHSRRAGEAHLGCSDFLQRAVGNHGRVTARYTLIFETWLPMGRFEGGKSERFLSVFKFEKSLGKSSGARAGSTAKAGQLSTVLPGQTRSEGGVPHSRARSLGA